MTGRQWGGSVEDAFVVPVVLRLGEDDHGVLRDKGNAMVSSTTSLMTWSDGNERLKVWSPR